MAKKCNKRVLLSFECLDCGGKVEIYKPRQFKSCDCGEAYGDSGDGYYYRLGGSAKGAYLDGKKEAKKGGR